MSGFEDTSTEALLVVQSNLLKGLEGIGRSIAAGTFETIEKAGSAPPSECGWLTVALLLGVEDELEGRIKGFTRVLDLNLLKTL